MKGDMQRLLPDLMAFDGDSEEAVMLSRTNSSDGSEFQGYSSSSASISSHSRAQSSSSGGGVQDFSARGSESSEEFVAEQQWEGLDTLEGVAHFLQAHGSPSSLAHAQRMIAHFNDAYELGTASLPDEFRIEAWRGTVKRIARTLADSLMDGDQELLRMCRSNMERVNQVHLAAETWVLAHVHDKILEGLAAMASAREAKITRMLSKLEKVPTVIQGVREEQQDAALGEAVARCRTMPLLRSPLEKALCLKKTITSILNGIQRTKRESHEPRGDFVPCTDDLLSLMLLVLTKAKVPRLLAQAMFIEHFLNLHLDDGLTGELGYHLTNLLAACAYLQSEQSKTMSEGAGPQVLDSKAEAESRLETEWAFFQGSPPSSNEPPSYPASAHRRMGLRRKALNR